MSKSCGRTTTNETMVNYLVRSSSDEHKENASPREPSKEVDVVTSFAHCKQRNQKAQGNGVAQKKGKRILLDVSQITAPKLVLQERQEETDLHRISQRQKQIDYGKNTGGYERYIEHIPRDQRKKGDPQTPDVKQVCSKRSWDGQVRKWRRLLHDYDLPDATIEEKLELIKLDGSPKNHDRKVRTAKTKNKPKTATELLKIYQDWVAKEP